MKGTLQIKTINGRRYAYDCYYDPGTKQTKTDYLGPASKFNQDHHDSLTKSPIEFNQDLFNVIYADPPWRYDFSISKSRQVETHYPTMALEEICALEIPSASDAVLFLWVPAPKLQDGLTVMTAWGFNYRTHMVWEKDKLGPGWYFRSIHEDLLLGTKGALGCPLPPDRPRSIFKAARKEHSRKPDSVYALIERMYPEGRYLELFARERREGWTVWGNEIPTTTQTLLKVKEDLA